MNTPLIPEDIHQHILNQAGSNLSIIQYCKMHALTYHRMLYFKKKLNDHELKELFVCRIASGCTKGGHPILPDRKL